MNALTQWGPDIWIAPGPPVRFLGMPFPTRMIVVRLGDGSLWIDSPVQWPRNDMEALREIGPVAHLVSPTPLHDWRLEAWQPVFPQARAWRARDLGDQPPAQWAADIDQLLFRGSRVIAEAEFYHRASRTLLLTDYVQQHPPAAGARWRNLVTKLAGLQRPAVPPDIRLSFAGNHAEGRRSLARLLSWDFDSVVPAHGQCLREGAKPAIETAFAWLR